MTCGTNLYLYFIYILYFQGGLSGNKKCTTKPRVRSKSEYKFDFLFKLKGHMHVKFAAMKDILFIMIAT